MSNIRRPVLLLTFLNLLASGAGFIREIVTAYLFGTSAAADAFAVVIFYLDAVGVVFQYGLASYMLVPLVTGLIAKNESDKGFRVVETILFWLALLSIPLIVYASLYPKSLAVLLVPKFSETQLSFLVQLMGFGSIALSLMILSSLVSGFLRAHADYYSPVAGRALFSLSVAVILVAGSEWGFTTGALAICLGSVAQTALVVWSFRKLGWRFRKPQWGNSFLGKAVLVGLPSVIALVFTNLVMGGAQRSIASGLPVGAIAAVSYAQRTLSLVSGFSLSLVTVSITELSVQFHAEKGMGSRGLSCLRDTISIGFLVLIPLSFLLFAISEPLIALLFRRGQYDAQSLQVTTECLKWFTLALVPGMLAGQLQGAVCPVFQRHWSVLLVSVIQAAVTLLLTYLLLDLLQASALPVALAGGLVACALVSIVAVWDLVGAGFITSLAWYAFKVALIALTSFTILMWFQLLPVHSESWTTWSALGGITESALAFSFVFCSVSIVARDPYMMSFLKRTRNLWA